MNLISVYTDCVDSLDQRAIELIGRLRFAALRTTARDLREPYALVKVETARRRPA